MTNNQHNEDLLSDTKVMLKKIDNLPLHSKYKILIYQHYVLSRFSWNLTISDITLLGLSSLWIVCIVNQYIRSWLKIHIAGALENALSATYWYQLDSRNARLSSITIYKSLQIMTSLKFIMIRM